MGGCDEAELSGPTTLPTEPQDRTIGQNHMPPSDRVGVDIVDPVAAAGTSSADLPSHEEQAASAGGTHGQPPSTSGTETEGGRLGLGSHGQGVSSRFSEGLSRSFRRGISSWEDGSERRPRTLPSVGITDCVAAAELRDYYLGLLDGETSAAQARGLLEAVAVEIKRNIEGGLQEFYEKFPIDPVDADAPASVDPEQYIVAVGETMVRVEGSLFGVGRVPGLCEVAVPKDRKGVSRLHMFVFRLSRCVIVVDGWSVAGTRTVSRQYTEKPRTVEFPCGHCFICGDCFERMVALRWGGQPVWRSDPIECVICRERCHERDIARGRPVAGATFVMAHPTDNPTQAAPEGAGSDRTSALEDGRMERAPTMPPCELADAIAAAAAGGDPDASGGSAEGSDSN